MKYPAKDASGINKRSTSEENEKTSLAICVVDAGAVDSLRRTVSLPSRRQEPVFVVCDFPRRMAPPSPRSAFRVAVGHFSNRRRPRGCADCRRRHGSRGRHKETVCLAALRRRGFGRSIRVQGVVLRTGLPVSSPVLAGLFCRHIVSRDGSRTPNVQGTGSNKAFQSDFGFRAERGPRSA